MVTKQRKAQVAQLREPLTQAGPPTPMPSLPDGFEKFNDDDGDELVRPTPKNAVDTLLDMLVKIAPWERFPTDPDQWTPSQCRDRGRPMRGNVMITGTDKNGGHFEFEVPDDPPAVLIVPPKKGSQRERLTRQWEQRTGRQRTKAEPVIRRSPIDDRRQLVQGMRTGFDVFVPQAIVAVLAAGGSAEPLRELERDPELCTDTVAAAVAELRKLTAAAADLAELRIELKQDMGAERHGLTPTGFAFFRVLVEADGEHLDYQGIFLAAQRKDPAAFRRVRPDNRHQATIRELVGHEGDGMVVRGTGGGRGRRREFWVEAAG